MFNVASKTRDQCVVCCDECVKSQQGRDFNGGNIHICMILFHTKKF